MRRDREFRPALEADANLTRRACPLPCEIQRTAGGALIQTLTPALSQRERECYGSAFTVGATAGFFPAPFVHWSSQSSTVSCQWMLLAGFTTQWFSSGK